MKKAKRICASVLLLALSLNMAACRNTEDPNNGGTVSQQERPAQYAFTDPASQVESIYPETDSILVQNNASDYVVVIPANSQKEERAAAERLVQHIASATNTELRIVTDDQYSGSKAIFIGNTKQTASAGVTLPQTPDESTHTIKTIDGSCYLLGTTAVANHFAVTTFLKHTVGYAMYSVDEVTLVKMSGVKMRNFPGDVYEPAIRYRTLGSAAARNNEEFNYANYIYGGSWMSPRGSGNAWHNSLDFLPPAMFLNEEDAANYHPEWYAGGGVEVCYTAHGDAQSYAEMVDVCVDVVIEAAQQNPDAGRMTFTMQDAAHWCNCDACIASEQKYGAKNASCILLLNAIMDKVNAYMDEHMGGRRIALFFFSYSVALKAPAKWDDGASKWVPTYEELYPHEGVGVMYAPIAADYARPFTDDQNADFYTLLQQWSDMGFPVALWVYSMNLITFFAPLNSFYTDIVNYPLYEQAGVMWLYNQGQWQNNGLTAFHHMKEMIQCQLAWDSDYDVNAYMDRYFVAHFKDAAPIMRKYYDDFRVRLTYCTETLNINGWIGTEWLYSSEAFPYGEICKYLDYIDQAYAAIEPLKKSDPEAYELAYKHILAESLFPRYYAITLFGGNYTNTELLEMKKQFRTDCDLVGFTYTKEHNPINNLWTSWGI